MSIDQELSRDIRRITLFPGLDKLGTQYLAIDIPQNIIVIIPDILEP